ncbi:MAG: hypothetical protein E7163_00220 [Firmicutes bacterium]|nr:hypothetical protein [Bacillota bacterium]
MYKKDDYVVYKHDVCKIKDVKENRLMGNTYYVMTPIDDDTLIIDIPIENRMGFLRDVISSEDAEKLINKISKIQPLDNINDKNIEMKYKELLNAGGHENLIKIIKTTYLRNEDRINNKKKISEKDNTFFKLAEKYLYNELSVALNKSVEEVKKYITEKVSK